MMLKYFAVRVLYLTQRFDHCSSKICYTDFVTQVDLLLVIGDMNTVAGYPPLGLQKCEIHHLGPARRVSQQSLRAVTRKFESTWQRFGK